MGGSELDRAKGFCKTRRVNQEAMYQISFCLLKLYAVWGQKSDRESQEEVTAFVRREVTAVGVWGRGKRTVGRDSRCEIPRFRGSSRCHNDHHGGLPAHWLLPQPG